MRRFVGIHNQHRGGVRVKVRNDNIWRFPRTRPVWLPDPKWSAEGADRAKTGVEKYCASDRQHSEMRSSMTSSG